MHSCKLHIAILSVMMPLLSFAQMQTDSSQTDANQLEIAIQPTSFQFQMLYPTGCGSYETPSGKIVYASGIFNDTVAIEEGASMVYLIDLTIFPVSNDTVHARDCYEYFNEYSNEWLKEEGFHTTVITSENECVNTHTVNLKLDTASSVVSAKSCDSFFWPANKTTYNHSGIYTDTLQTKLGCDSIVTLQLDIQKSKYDTSIVSACDEYTWSSNGKVYKESGIYINSFETAFGCDSVEVLDLTILNSNLQSSTVQACNAYFWSVTEETYNKSGIFTANFTNKNGCDSIITLDLEVTYDDFSTIEITACDKYLWPVNSKTYYESGSYQALLKTTAGCDSSITLNLTINQPDTIITTAKACNSFYWNLDGNTYETSGTYTAYFTNAKGCDSLVVLNLNVIQVDTALLVTDYELFASIDADSYQWLDCNNNNAPIENGTNQSYKPTISGVYAVELTKDACIDTSACVEFLTKDVAELKQNYGVSLFPNPTGGQVTLTIDANYRNAQYELRNSNGKMMLARSLYNQKEVKFTINGNPGIYFLTLTIEDQEPAVFRIIKK